MDWFGVVKADLPFYVASGIDFIAEGTCQVMFEIEKPTLCIRTLLQQNHTVLQCINGRVPSI